MFVREGKIQKFQLTRSLASRLGFKRSASLFSFRLRGIAGMSGLFSNPGRPRNIDDVFQAQVLKHRK